MDEAELIQAKLYGQGCMGLEEESSTPGRVRLRSYFEAHGALSEFIVELKKETGVDEPVASTTIDLGSIIQSIPTFEPIEWVGCSSTNADPASGVWIFPPDDMATNSRPNVEKKIIIRPGMGFGTGRHETTRLTAELMQEVSAGVKSLADIGSGSGILAIYGRQELRIPQVDAVEIDENARDNALENFELNGVKNIALHASIDQISGPYDMIAANIILSTLKYLKKDFVRLIKKDGFLVLSGVLVEEEAELFDYFKGDFELIKPMRDKVWTASLWQRRS